MSIIKEIPQEIRSKILDTAQDQFDALGKLEYVLATVDGTVFLPNSLSAACNHARIQLKDPREMLLVVTRDLEVKLSTKGDRDPARVPGSSVEVGNLAESLGEKAPVIVSEAAGEMAPSLKLSLLTPKLANARNGLKLAEDDLATAEDRWKQAEDELASTVFELGEIKGKSKEAIAQRQELNVKIGAQEENVESALAEVEVRTRAVQLASELVANYEEKLDTLKGEL